ncbi:MAG TPA: AraC family transcriptional regulator [Thermoanaerobaculia bacterium]
MAGTSHSAESLSGGQFYGEVLRRRCVSGLVLTELRHQRRRSFPRHGHELAYFCLLMDGGYCERIAGRPVAQVPMSLAFHPPGLEHHDEVGEGGGRFFSIEVEGRWLERLRQESRIAPDFAVLSAARPLGLAARLYRELRAFQGPGLLVEELALDLLAAAVRQPIAAERRPPAWLSAVEERLREGFREPLGLDDLAAVAGVHPVHVTRTFRRFRGQTPGEYLQDLRVRHLCAALADPERPLSDLALEAGFADQSHCTRVFKRHTGMTPGVFRAALGR